MSRADKTAAELRACASAWAPCVHLVGNVRCDDIIELCDRYARAVELLRTLDTQASFRGARNPDVAAFLEGEVES